MPGERVHPIWLFHPLIRPGWRISNAALFGIVLAGQGVCLRGALLPTSICREPSAGKSSCSHYRAWRWPYGPPLFNGRYYWLAIMNLPRIGQYRSSHPECAAGNPCCQRHPAIAAGRHSKLSDSPYAFLRQHYTLLRRLPGFGWLLRGVG